MTAVPLREAVERLAEEGLLLRGGARGLAPFRALLRAWRRRGDWGLDSDEAVDEALGLAYNNQYVRAALGEAVAAGRPVRAEVAEGRDGSVRVVFHFQSGLRAVWREPDPILKLRLSERVRALYDFWVLRGSVRNGRMEVEAAVRLKTSGDPRALEKALNILGEYVGEAAPAYLPCIFVTSECDAVAALLFSLRQAALAGGAGDAYVLHVAEVGSLGTLKSTFARLAEAFDEAWRLNEWPTVATLIGDARTGYSRLAAVRTLVFDEFTKWQRRSGDRFDIWGPIANGMTHCVWSRAAGGSNAPSVAKCINTVWLGNPDAVRPVTGQGLVPPRDHVRRWLEDAAGLAGENLESMMSRLSVYGSYLPREKTTRLVAGVHGYVPRPGLYRALADRVRETGASVYEKLDAPGGGDARLAERYRALRASLEYLLSGHEGADEIALAAARGVLVITGEGVETL